MRISIAYTQAISNIVTDLIYATAPIAYLQSVQLSIQTQWSVRAVFLMSLIHVRCVRTECPRADLRTAALPSHRSNWSTFRSFKARQKHTTSPSLYRSGVSLRSLLASLSRTYHPFANRSTGCSSTYYQTPLPTNFPQANNRMAATRVTTCQLIAVKSPEGALSRRWQGEAPDTQRTTRVTKRYWRTSIERTMARSFLASCGLHLYRSLDHVTGNEKGFQ